MSIKFNSGLIRQAVILGAMLSSPSVVFAATDGVDEVVVRATRIDKPVSEIPSAIGVVGKDDIQLGRQQLGLDESLAAIPGLFMQDRYNFAQDLRIAIRGFGARSNFGIRGVKILVDGIPESLPDGQGQVDGIDLGSAQQIEVLRGPSSALYGNASGGVINITSEKGPAVPFVELRLSAGEFDFEKIQLKAGGDTGRLNYLINVSDLQFDGFRTHSETENTSFNGRFVYTVDEESELGVVLSATDQPLANDPGAITIEDATAQPRLARQQNVDFDAGETLDQQRIGFSYKKSFGEQHELRMRNHYVWRDFATNLPFVNGGVVQFDRVFLGGGISYTYRGEFWGRPSNVIVGLDLDRQDDDRRRFDNNSGVIGSLVFDQDETVTSVGLFAQTQVALSDEFALTLGLRYDDVEFEVDDKFLTDGDASGQRNLNNVSPMIGAVYTPSASINVYATISTAFETPTTTEFANPGGAGGFNPDIDPQTATNYEIGLRGNITRRYRYEAAVFHIDVEDELIPFELATEPRRDFFSNAGESSRRGLELSFQGEPIDGLTVALAYTYSDFQFDRFTDDDGNDFAGNTIPGVPDDLLRLEFAYRHASGFYGSLDALKVGDFLLNNANTAANDSYTVLGLRAGLADYKLGSWTWSPFVGVNNLTDQSYAQNARINAFGGRFFEPAPDRHWYAGVALRFDFGAPR